jgi:hypothetical protein
MADSTATSNPDGNQCESVVCFKMNRWQQKKHKFAQICHFPHVGALYFRRCHVPRDFFEIVFPRGKNGLKWPFGPGFIEIFKFCSQHPGSILDGILRGRCGKVLRYSGCLSQSFRRGFGDE